MKQLTLIITILIPLNIFSQINGIVIDKKTEKSITFSNIWVENEFVGTTSDYNGNFNFHDSLVNRNIIVSAIGYETQNFLLADKFNRVLLVPKSYAIEEIVIKPVKKKKM